MVPNNLALSIKGVAHFGWLVALVTNVKLIDEYRVC